MKKKTTIKYEGPHTEEAIRIVNKNGKILVLKLEEGKVDFDVNVDQIYKIFWFIVGPNGARYKISMSTADGYKVYARANPINRRVPEGNAGWGRMKFLIGREDANVAAP